MSDIIIDAKNLIKTFSIKGKNNNCVLNNISFEIKRNKITALMGPSGVGKSTLLYILGTLDNSNSGIINFYSSKGETFCYNSMNSNNLSYLRNKYIGFVFQFHHLLPEFNILDNIIMPALILGTATATAKQKALELMKKMNIPYFDGELIGTVVHVAVDNQYAGYIIIADEVKADSVKAIKDLKAANIKQTVMLTGDAKNVAEVIWANLNEDNRVAIVVKFIDIETILPKNISEIDNDYKKYVDNLVDNNYKDANLILKLAINSSSNSNTNNYKIKYSLFDSELKKVIEENSETFLNNKLEINKLVQNPKQWSDEKPNLYTLIIELLDGDKSIELIKQKVGFRELEISI